MKKEKVRKTLHQSIQKNGAVTLYRFCDPIYKTIWPLAVSEKLILGCRDNDFLLDGFEILRIKDIYKIYAQDSLYDQIMRQEHILDSITKPNICIQSWKTVLTDLAIQEKTIIIEQENVDEAKSIFSIGQIKKIDKGQIYFRYFDADGVWSKKPRIIPYKEITRISFDGRYEQTYGRYVTKNFSE